MKNWLFSYIFSHLDNICKLMLSGICTLFHQTSPTFSYAYGPEESLLVPDFLQFMCTAVHAIFSFLASFWLLRFLFLFMYSTSIPMGIWAICRSNIVGRNLQLGRGDSSVPTPEQLWEVVEKGVHWGGGGTASSQLKTGG